MSEKIYKILEIKGDYPPMGMTGRFRFFGAWMNFNCRNCGAPPTNGSCNYCGTMNEQTKCCDNCNGKGYVMYISFGNNPYEKEVCGICKGKGVI